MFDKHRSLLFPLLVCAAFIAPASAQDFSTVAPKQPAAPKPGVIQIPPSSLPATAVDKQLLGNLTGIRFVPSVKEIARNGATGTGIEIETLPMMDDPVLRSRLSTFLGKPLMTSDLPLLTRLAGLRHQIEVGYSCNFTFIRGTNDLDQSTPARRR